MHRNSGHVQKKYELLQCSSEKVSKLSLQPNPDHYLFLYRPPAKNAFTIFNWLKNIK